MTFLEYFTWISSSYVCHKEVVGGFITNVPDFTILEQKTFSMVYPNNLRLLL